MSTSNPPEPSAQRKPKKLRSSDYVIYTLLFFQAACAGLIFPLIPDYFEAMSLKAGSLLDVIELGRARPWVIFTGMPYPATLRLFGDVCGVMAVLIVLTFILSNPVSIVSSGNWKERIKNPNSSYWYISLIGLSLLNCIGLYLGSVFFITPLPFKVTDPSKLGFYISAITPIKVTRASQLVYNMLGISAITYWVAMMSFLSGYILYCRISMARI